MVKRKPYQITVEVMNSGRREVAERYEIETAWSINRIMAHARQKAERKFKDELKAVEVKAMWDVRKI